MKKIKAIYANIYWDDVIRRIPDIMGLDLTWHNNTWVGKYYINREPHTYRKNKLTVKLYGGNIYVFEQGGPHMSIVDWLIQFGGAANEYAAISILKRGCGCTYVMPGESQQALKPVRYVTRPDYELYFQNDRNRCPLYVWMERFFGRSRVVQVWNKYGVTSDFKGNVVFWYFDTEGRICYDKVMKYGYDGHRDHTFGGSRQYKTGEGYTARPFYGSNLIPKSEEEANKNKLYLVESEKTALICAIVFPEYTWLSCGGKSNLKDLDKKFVLFPDMDAIDDWDKNKHEARICDWWAGEDVGSKDDIADLIVRKITNRESFDGLKRALAEMRTPTKLPHEEDSNLIG